MPGFAMPDDNSPSGGEGTIRLFLRDILRDRYPLFVQRLTRRFGSADRAHEALHDVWLRLERGGDIGTVRHPMAYLARAAINADFQRRKTASRQTRLLQERADDVLPEPTGLETVAQRRSEWAAMRRAIASLPERRRVIFLAAYGEDIALIDIATRHGVTVRTIQMELKAALEQLAWDLRS
jgi:RNA polymerase sigma-70 factor, ECF subfamily